MTRGPDNPWLNVPAADYEAHMADIGQSAALRTIFAQVYAAIRPRRLLVLGCGTGQDLTLIDPTVTTTACGVDINLEYLKHAHAACDHLAVDLIPGDVMRVDLPPATFDLVHAALLLEYVDPAAVFQRIRRWLAPGGVCSIVSQDPAVGVPSVSRTPYDSLLALERHMSLRGAEQVREAAVQAGLVRTSLRTVALPGGKTISSSLFGAAAAAEHRPHSVP